MLVGDVDDPAEREAEHVARRVGRAERISGIRAPASTGVAVSPRLERRIDAAQGAGAPLSGGVRHAMERSLGADLGAVRIHADGESAQLSRALQAKAFTTGSDVFMAEGRYAPGTSEGRELLAHELAHVVQQTGAIQRVPSLIQRVPDPSTVNWGSAGNLVPSGSGALGGVVFMTVGNDHVAIKPGKGSAASALFAEDVLGTVGDTQTTESAAVRKADPAFAPILNRIRSEAASAATPGTPAARFAQRWGEPDFIKHYVGADYFLVQKSMLSPDLGTAQKPAAQNQEFSDTYKTDPLKILQDVAFLESVGRTLVADILIGNADRLESINGGNFFVLGTSKVGAIDNESFFPSQKLLADYFASQRGSAFAEATDDNSQRRFPKGEPMHRHWVEYLVGGGPGLETAAPVSNVREMYDRLDRWIQYSFMSVFTKMAHVTKEPAAYAVDQQRLATMNAAGLPVRAQENVQAQDIAASAQWIAVRDAIRRGFADGMQRLHHNLTGTRGRQMRLRFLALQHQYGESENMDFGAFEVRAAYLTARHAGKSDKEAFELAARKAEVKVTDKVARVIAATVTYGYLTRQGASRLSVALSELTVPEQESLVHVRPGVRKTFAKLPLLGSGNKWDDNYERLRGRLLRRLLDALDAEDLTNKTVRTSAAFKQCLDDANWARGVLTKHGADGGARSVAVWTHFNVP